MRTRHLAYLLLLLVSHAHAQSWSSGSFGTTSTGTVTSGTWSSFISGAEFTGPTNLNGQTFLGTSFYSGLLTLSGLESSQLQWDQGGGQQWKLNAQANGSIYFDDVTASHFPLVLQKGSAKALTIGAQINMTGLPAASPGSGGGYVCADSAGDLYVKATCP
jgi:hypothetical protein